jgi:hypothetical protein
MGEHCKDRERNTKARRANAVFLGISFLPEQRLASGLRFAEMIPSTPRSARLSSDELATLRNRPAEGGAVHEKLDPLERVIPKSSCPSHAVLLHCARMTGKADC